MSTSPSRSSPAAPVPTLVVFVMPWNVLPTLNTAVPAAATPANVAAAAPRARPNVLPEFLPAFSASLATPFVRAGPNSLREGKTGIHKPLASATGTTTYSVICIQLFSHASPVQQAEPTEPELHGPQQKSHQFDASTAYDATGQQQSQVSQSAEDSSCSSHQTAHHQQAERHAQPQPSTYPASDQLSYSRTWSASASPEPPILSSTQGSRLNNPNNRKPFRHHQHAPLV